MGEGDITKNKVMSIAICLLMIISISAPFTQNVGQPQNLVQSGPSPTSGGSGGLANSPWPMFRQNLNHTGVSPYDTSMNPGKFKWSFTTDGVIFSSPTIGSDNTIYIGSNDDKLYAINPNGTEKWSFTTGDNVHSVPSITSDGTIYVGSDDHKLYAINPNGTMKWSFITGESLYSSPAIGSDGTIYIGSGDHNLYAIYPNGTKKWSFATIGGLTSSPVINIDGTIYVGSSHPGYKLYAINSDGTEKWNFTTKGDVFSSPAIGSDGTIYVGSIDHKLYAINPDGTEKWNFSTGSNIESSPAIGSDGTIYVGSSDHKLYAISPDGSTKWSFTTGHFIYLSSPAISSDGTIYIGSQDHKLYAINSDGTEKWSFLAGREVLSSPAIGSDGTIYVGCYDNKLYAIGTLPVSDAGPNQTVNEGDVMELNGSASYDPDGIIEAYEWDFDLSDGLWWETGATLDATSPTATHVYGDDGLYTVTLRVTEDRGGKDTDTCIISVNNIAPTISSISTPIGNEGSSITFTSSSNDPGSDDLTFTWNWGDGTSDTISTHYNDGVSPDPYPSPSGIFPFSAKDTVQHTYGDNGEYLITLTIEDDDGGTVNINSTVVVNNVGPTITLTIFPSGDEGSLLTFAADASDPGSDDLTFTWEFEMGPTVTNVYYNDGVGSDPYPSPWGTYPYPVSDSVEHTYGDNGVYPVTLTVSDDDGGMTSFMTNITVNNVAPTIATVEANMYVNFSLRVAGEKYHSVGIHLFEDDVEIWNAQVTRVPGSPDAQAATLSGYYINFGSTYSAIVDYIPNDPRINGNVWGGNPVWIDMEFQDGTTERLHHTFNVKQSDWDSDHWNHIDPWEVDLTGKIYRHNITFEAMASDPGSDDLTFFWDFGDGGNTSANTYFNNGITSDLYPSPEINPINVSDTVMHAYDSSGVYTVTLTVVDDDGGIVTTTLTIVLPG